MSYSWFRSGTCTVDASNIVRFENANIGTAPNNPVVGDAFVINGGVFYEIIFIGNDATGDFVRLQRPYAEASATDIDYAIVRFASGTQNAKLVAMASTAINQKQISLDDIYEWYTSTADTLDFSGYGGETVTVTTYHKLSNEITTVGSISGDIAKVATQALGITAVAGEIASVKAVGDNIASVKTVSDGIASVKGVNANISEVLGVGAKLTAINQKSAQVDQQKQIVDTKTAQAILSEANALAYKNSASRSSTASTSKALEAFNSADAAKISETNSKASETNAKTSETNSMGIETIAATKAREAQFSAASASVSATTAGNSVTAAELSATAAKSSETNSLASETKARNQAALASAHVVSAYADGGSVDLSSGQLPTKPNTATFWHVVNGGTADGVTYALDETLAYSRKADLFYKLRTDAQSVWGNINGNLQDQTDLAAKLNALVPWTRITGEPIFTTRWPTPAEAGALAVDGVAKKVLIRSNSYGSNFPILWGAGSDVYKSAGNKLMVQPSTGDVTSKGTILGAVLNEGGTNLAAKYLGIDGAAKKMLITPRAYTGWNSLLWGNGNYIHKCASDKLRVQPSTGNVVSKGTIDARSIKISGVFLSDKYLGIDATAADVGAFPITGGILRGHLRASSDLQAGTSLHAGSSIHAGSYIMEAGVKLTAKYLGIGGTAQRLLITPHGDANWRPILWTSGSNVHSCANNKLRVKPSTGSILSMGTVTANYRSDINVKKNIVPITNASEMVSNLGFYSYEYKEPDLSFEGKQYGLIAQDVEKILPEIVSHDDEGFKRIKTGGYELVGLLCQAHNEQSKRVDELEKRLASLEALVKGNN